MTEALRCSNCGAPTKPEMVRCEYCGLWLKSGAIDPEPIDPSEFNEFFGDGVDLNAKYGRLTMAGLGIVFVSLFSLVIMATIGGFAHITNIWPTANAEAVSNASQTATLFLDILLGMLGLGAILTGSGMAWHRFKTPSSATF